MGNFTKLDPRRDLTCLDQFKTTPFVPRYPTDRRVFYSPVDDVPSVLLACIGSAQKDVLVAMYGLDDDAVTAVILDKVNSENVNVSLVLDKSQAHGKHESVILAEIAKGAPQCEVVIGNSEKHAIQHLKMAVIDGSLTIQGSTNWSVSGETKQDNELNVDIDPYVAIEATHRINAIRLSMLHESRLLNAALSGGDLRYDLERLVQ